MSLDGEVDLGAGGAADPVLLHFESALRPVQPLQAVQQLFGVGGDLEDPLADGLAVNRVVSDLAASVDDLLVGQHGSERGAPVHRLVGLVGQALLEELAEDPLGPLVVVGAAGADFAVPVEGEAEGVELALEVLDVLGGGDLRVRAGLDGVLLGGQSEGIPAHGVQHVIAIHALEAAPDVGGGVALGMADVESRAGRIRKHVQHVELLAAVVAVHRPEGLVVRPVSLPLRLDLRRLVLLADKFVAHFSSILI